METRLNLSKVLTEQEETAIFAEADRRLYSDKAADQRAGLVVWLALTLGLRVSELARLSWSDFDSETGRVDCWRHKKGCGKSGDKSDKRDSVYPPDVLFSRLEGFRQPGGAVFGGVGKRVLQSDWRACAQAAGLRPIAWGIHAARHTAATRIARASGGNVMAVRDFLGHSDRSIGITAQYIGRDPARLKAVSNQAWPGLSAGMAAEVIEGAG